MKQIKFPTQTLFILFVASLAALAATASTALAGGGYQLRISKTVLPVPTAFDSQAIDLNGDGNIDLAILPDDGLYVALGDGHGNFSQPIQYNKGGFQNLLAFGDLDGDGFPDAVVANYPGINVLLNDGAGGFPVSTFINTGAQPAGLAVADFNGDGNLDLAVSDFKANSISIFAGDGHGGFAAPLIFATGTSPNHLVARDFDGDGVLDLAVAEYGSMDLRIFKGLGDGRFSAGAIYALGGNAESLVAADFDQDGHVDLAVNVFNIFPNNHVAVFTGDGHGNFVQSASLHGDVFLGLAAADLNGDGYPDVTFLENYHLDVALSDGSGGFRPVRRVSLFLASGGYTISAGDFNNDGRIDLFTTPGTGALLFNVPLAP